MRGTFQFGTTHRFADITDGLSNTILVGEKQVAVGKEGSGGDCSIYNGDHGRCSTRAAGVLHPLTTDPRDPGWKFGSRHTGVVQFGFADGRVQALRDTTDGYTLELLTMRNDGQVVTVE